MFTGIIESEGTINSLVKKGADISVKVLFDNGMLDDIQLGDSIAVNGVCLTVEALTNNELSFYLSVESISKIADLKLNQKVNLERSLKMNGRISGHFVFGHVDGVCDIKEKQPRINCYEKHRPLKPFLFDRVPSFLCHSVNLTPYGLKVILRPFGPTNMLSRA